MHYMVKPLLSVTLEVGTRSIVGCIRLKKLSVLTVIDISMFNIIVLRRKTTSSGFPVCELAMKVMK